MCILSIFNQKGGVGKTITSLNLASGLSLKDKKVLLIDIDPQSSLTRTLITNSYNIKNDFSSFFDFNFKDYSSLILKTNIENVDIIPSTMNLINLERKLILNEDKKFLLKEKINLLKKENKYDFIIIDCPSAINLILKSTLKISDFVLIPTNLEFFSIDALTNLLPLIYKIKKDENNDLKIIGILITMYEKKYSFSKEIEFELNKFFKGNIFKTKIPYSIKISESPSFNQSIFTYSKKSMGSYAYRNFVEEFLNSKEISSRLKSKEEK